MNKKLPRKGNPVEVSFETMEEVDAYYDAEKLTCLMCGHAYVALHVHLRNSHAMTADEYKEKYGIPWRRGLISKAHKDKQVRIINEQRAKGILPPAPTSAHIRKLIEAARTNRRPLQKPVRKAMSDHALKTHGRTERWGEEDFEEYLLRIQSGRTITEVGRDEDMPCREVFDTYKRENPDFRKKLEAIWDSLPYAVQVRGLRLGQRFKKELAALRQAGKTWPEISKILGVKESTARNAWHRLKLGGELAKDLKRE